MDRTKIGLSVGMMAFLLYAMGIVNFLGLILLAVYVFAFEENEWLKKTAVKVVAIVVIFALISTLFSVFGQTDSLFNSFLSLINFSAALSIFDFFFSFLDYIGKFIGYILYIAEMAILAFGAFKAIKQKDFNIPFIDKFLYK